MRGAQSVYFVYILQSEKDNGFYIGCSSNLNQRIACHNSGKTVSLRHRKPLKLVYTEIYTSAKEAFEREKKLKSYKGGLALKKILVAQRFNAPSCPDFTSATQNNKIEDPR